MVIKYTSLLPYTVSKLYTTFYHTQSSDFLPPTDQDKVSLSLSGVIYGERRVLVGRSNFEKGLINEKHAVIISQDTHSDRQKY